VWLVAHLDQHCPVRVALAEPAAQEQLNIFALSASGSDWASRTPSWSDGELAPRSRIAVAIDTMRRHTPAPAPDCLRMMSASMFGGRYGMW
jgi:hypothetical protein